MKSFDVVVIGGGIAGLWILASLRSAGYRAILLEKNALGAGQTLASQGIIHGGTKYALTGKLTGSSEAVRAMPARWRQHLAGEQQPDLSATKINTPYQWMWSAGGVASKISNFLASKVMSSRVEAVSADQLPASLTGKQVYQLQEPVLDIQSVLQQLSATGSVYRAQVMSVDVEASGQCLLNIKSGDRELQIQANMVVHAAGEGNERLQSAAMQRRPLHMVMVKGELPPIWGHVIEANANPRLTITSHESSDSQIVWYVGGQLAEDAAMLDDEQLIAMAKKELGNVFPSIDWQTMAWSTLKINRAEGQQADSGRPAEPVISEQGNQITIWPTKLVFAPMVADEVLRRIKAAGQQASLVDGEDKPDLPVAGVGTYPWDTAQWV